MLKEFLMKQMLKSKLKDMPEAQRDLLLGLVEKHPEFFEKIAKEIKVATDGGKEQNAASMGVMMKYKGELQKLLQKS